MACKPFKNVVVVLLCLFPLPPPSSSGVHFAATFVSRASIAALEAGRLWGLSQLVGWSHPHYGGSHPHSWAEGLSLSPSS